MIKYIFLLISLLINGLIYSQEYNDPCVTCAEALGFYCGDDESNWTQYSPEGCVQNSWLNDGWEDCVDASDENGAVPTPIEECAIIEPICDTVYVEVPVIEYDTIVEIQYITDTLYVDVINWFPEYVDCETGLPCNISMIELIDESNDSNLMYNLKGQPLTKPSGIYIKDGKLLWHK